MTTLSIGLRGYYEANGVFENIIKKRVNYTCETIESLRSMVENGLKPYEQIYIPAGLNRTDFDQDYNNNIVVAGLRLDNGTLTKLPVYYIQKMPDANGVLYNGKMIGIALNSMPLVVSLDDLIEEIKDFVKTRIGVDCKVSQTAYTPDMLVDYDRHLIVEGIRNENITNFSSQNRIRELELALSASAKKTKVLEDYIKSLIAD